MSTITDLDARTRIRAVLVAVAVVLCGLLASASPAQAHTAFVGSDPADGSIVTEPVDEIVIEFTGVSTPAGEGFVALDADGRVRTPTTVSTDDDKVFRLAFDPPLAGGIVGVRWSVRAGDAHPIEGSFSFTVDAVTAPLDDPGDTAIDELTVAGSDDGDTAASSSALEEFLAVDGRAPGETGARVGRLVSFGAVVLALGALASTWASPGCSTRAGGPRGRRRPPRRPCSEAWPGWRSPSGSLRSWRRSADPMRCPQRRRPRWRAGRPDPVPPCVGSPTGRPGSRSSASLWRSSRSGSTATRSRRAGGVLHALANGVHVVAGSIWVGGVVSMAVVLWRRHRAGRPSDAMGLVVLRPALEKHPGDAGLQRSIRSTVTAEAIVLAFVVAVTAWLVAAAS